MTQDQAQTLRHMRMQRMRHLQLVDRPRPASSRVVAVTGGKGGVGKSNLAANLAVSWARAGARALALDADLGMADLNLLLGQAPEKSLADVLQGCPIDEVVIEAHGIGLLPGLNGSFALANLDERRRHALLAAVDTLEDRYDTLVIDTGAGLDGNAIDFAGAAAQIVVVATPEPLSLADAYACLKALEQRQGVRSAFVLPNRVRSPSEADEVFTRLASVVDRFLGVALTPLPAIPFDPCMGEAAAAGVPLVLYRPDSPASRAITQAARRIDALARPDERQDGVRVFLGRATGRAEETT
jgi:flagellar biosynthesis protein FlhG